MEKDWKQQLNQKFQHDSAAQVSIDGRIYTLKREDKNRTGQPITMIDPFLDQTGYPSFEAVVQHFDSIFENPTIVVL